MIRQLIPFVILATLLAACSGELPLGPTTPQTPAQPVLATPIETKLPSTGTTPIMVEPPEQEAPRPINSEYLPQRDDGNLTRGNVYIDHSDLLIMESYPVQIALVLQGSLPTPCNQLRVIARPPDEQNRIQVEVYSVIDPAQVCVQVLEPFEANIGLGSFPTGHYSVWVNGEAIGEFDS
ncbi:MAG: hypothetical protein JW963_11995 [Anaerolineales bacterium]|nr:hypothetical protein [Anaerolineales bacterium]